MNIHALCLTAFLMGGMFTSVASGQSHQVPPTAIKYQVTIKGQEVLFSSPSQACTARFRADYGSNSDYRDAGFEPYQPGDPSIGCVVVADHSSGPLRDVTYVISVVPQCPQNAEYAPDSQAKSYVCHCRSGFLAQGSNCVQEGPSARSESPQKVSSLPSECGELRTLKGNQLKLKLTSLLQDQVTAANAQLISQPAIAATVLTERQIVYVFDSRGYRPAGKAGKPEIMTEAAFAVLYGQAVELLTARRVKEDACLSQVVEHLSPGQQAVEGQHNPDFRTVVSGTLEGMNFDVTTRRAAAKKQRDKQRQGWKFLTYDRGLILDKQGAAISGKPLTDE